MAQNLVPAITSVGLGLETIAVGKGPTGPMEAVMERLEEQTAMSAPVLVSTYLSSKPLMFNRCDQTLLR